MENHQADQTVCCGWPGDHVHRRRGFFTEPAGAEPQEKVFICHHTESATNPYVLIEVSSATLKHDAGHTDHEGHDLDIFPVPESGCPVDGDGLPD